MGIEGKLYWECSLSIARLQPSDSDLIEAEEIPMLQLALMVHKMMTVNDEKDGRHRMVVAGLVVAVVVIASIASIEPALAYCGGEGFR